MLHHHSDGPSGEGPAGAPPVLTALVVDDSFAARARITMLLQLGGWRVHQAVGTEDAPAPRRRDRARPRGDRHGHAERARGDPHAPAP